MRSRWLIILLFVVLFSGLTFAYLFSSSKNAESQTLVSDIHQSSLSSEKLTTLVNNWRVSQGLQPYIEDERLCTIAQDRSNDGMDHHKGLYEKYSDYPYVIQENSTFGNTSIVKEEDSLESWLKSKPHLETLKKAYRFSCIRTFESNAVQIFSNFSTN